MFKKNIVLAIMAIFVLSGLVGCSSGSVRDDSAACIKINSALVFSFGSGGNPAAYTEKTDAPESTIEGVEFEVFESGGQTVYSPLKEVKHETFLKIIDALSLDYGEPSYIDGSLYLWLPEEGTFELKAVYDENIHNNFALGVKDK